MHGDLDRLLSRYEMGQVSRRDLLASLAALLLPIGAAPSGAPGVSGAKHLNHVTLMVPTSIAPAPSIRTSLACRC